jgi:hypothetical protein
VANVVDGAATVRVNDSGWLAARCEGAHTNPIYVDFVGRPAGLAAPARSFINVIDRLAIWVEEKGLFDHEGQKHAVLDVIEDGRSVYEGIIERADLLGRE